MFELAEQREDIDKVNSLFMDTSDQEDLVKELEKLTLEQDDSVIDKERVVMEKEAIMFGNLDKELA